MPPMVYDMTTDTDRPITQMDVDKLQRTARAFGELVKHIKFYAAEVRNGLILPGKALEDITVALKEAENIAASLDLDTMLQDIGHVHGRHVLVVER